MFDVDKRTILRVRHGSHAYGLNIESSDVDIKGVCIEPLEYHFGFLNHFEQEEKLVSKGHSQDSVIYSLKKFVKLAGECNPNIIEVLFVDEVDVLFINEFGEMLRNTRQDFLSRKARFTFAGYAHSQLKRIKSHRGWLLDPPKAPPDRKNYGLGETTKMSKSELGALESLIDKSGDTVEISDNILEVFIRERQYQSAKNHWNQYQDWMRERNPIRAELEKNFGFDVKHGCHLIRLMRMCKEILNGHVIVKRHDREELLEIRSGQWSYDKLVDHAETLERECETLYETSVLPKSPDRNKLDRLVIDLTQKYVSLYG